MKKTPQEIITDKEVEKVHAYAEFGKMSKREVVNQAVLKCASGYYQGHTSQQIILEHKLITPKYKLTKKGKEYLWAVFSNDPEFSV